MEVFFTPIAEDDIDEIYQFIARDSAYYAGLVVDKIIHCTESLISTTPRCGRKQTKILKYENISDHMGIRYAIVYKTMQST